MAQVSEQPDDLKEKSEDDGSKHQGLAGEEPVTEANDEAKERAREKLRREREARAQALTLEIVGDLPYAEVKPPENVLFVCKLNPVTEGQTLSLLAVFEFRLTNFTPQTRTWIPSSAVSGP